MKKYISDNIMSKNHTVSRRHFLALAAVTAAGCATKTSVTPEVTRRPAPTGKPIRIGVIGCGMRGMQLINAVCLSQPSSAVIAAVCDAYAPRRIQAQKVSGADVCPAWEQLVARTDIEAVIIATPDHWHAPMAIAAMDAGKDVYCERPMALTIEEAKAFRDSAVRTKRVVQIGAQEALESRWIIARSLLQDNAVGTLRWSQADGGIGPRERQSPDWHPSSAEQATPETLDWKAFLGNAPERAFEPQRFFNGANTGIIHSGSRRISIIPNWPRC